MAYDRLEKTDGKSFANESLLIENLEEFDTNGNKKSRVAQLESLLSENLQNLQGQQDFYEKQLETVKGELQASNKLAESLQ